MTKKDAAAMEKLIRERHAAISGIKGGSHRAHIARQTGRFRSATDISRDIANWLLEHGPAYLSADGADAYVLEPEARTSPLWRHPDALHGCWNAYPMREDSPFANGDHRLYADQINRLRDRLESVGVDPDAFGAPARIVSRKGSDKNRRKVA